MLELLRGHYNAMIKIGEFRVYKFNNDEFKVMPLKLG